MSNNLNAKNVRSNCFISGHNCHRDRTCNSPDSRGVSNPSKMSMNLLPARKLSVRNGFLICLLLFVAWVLVKQFTPDEEDKIFSDMKALAKAEPPTFINQFDFICLGLSTDYKREFLAAGANTYQKSLETCGVGSSCCNNTSDVGFVGLGKADQMICVEIRRFDYWLENDKPLCTTPNALKVELQTADKATKHPGRPQFSPTRPSYRIGINQ